MKGVTIDVGFESSPPGSAEPGRFLPELILRPYANGNGKICFDGAIRIRQHRNNGCCSIWVEGSVMSPKAVIATAKLAEKVQAAVEEMRYPQNMDPEKFGTVIFGVLADNGFRVSADAILGAVRRLEYARDENKVYGG